jgi:predicted  nucleic acid-binding Zn-ribbon protein
VNTDYKKLDKKIDSLQEEYKALHQKIDSQEKTMSKASSQASAINANLSNAIAKTA